VPVVTQGALPAKTLLHPKVSVISAINEKIDILDLNILMVHWGETGGIGDFNGDGKVDILDFQSLMVNWTI